MNNTVIAEGLDGVTVSKTAIGRVNSDAGYYQYRQYDAVALNRKHSYEEVWYLLFHGSLPSPSQLTNFKAQIRDQQSISPQLEAVMRSLAQHQRQENILKLMAAAMGYFAAEQNFPASLDTTPEQLTDCANKLCSIGACVLAALYRLQHGQTIIKPRDDLSFAANYLYMMSGEEPNPTLAWAIERYLISVMDHGFNASTFTARVITSTGCDLGLAIVGAIGSLSGPLHGGAPSRVLDMLDEIKSPEHTVAWVDAKLAAKDKIMGFGHRVYREEDPRSDLMREVAEKIGGDRIKLAVAAERDILAVLARAKKGRKLCTNVEFFSSVVMEACQLPRTMFTPSFMVARMVGWCSHIIEQAANNRIYRPRSLYNGPDYTTDIP